MKNHCLNINRQIYIYETTYFANFTPHTISHSIGYRKYAIKDGSIVLNLSMTDDEADAIGGMAPGVTDLNNRFNGLVVMVAAGEGSVSVVCRADGSTEKVAIK